MHPYNRLFSKGTQLYLPNMGNVRFSPPLLEYDSIRYNDIWPASPWDWLGKTGLFAKGQKAVKQP